MWQALRASNVANTDFKVANTDFFVKMRMFIFFIMLQCVRILALHKSQPPPQRFDARLQRLHLAIRPPLRLSDEPQALP